MKSVILRLILILSLISNIATSGLQAQGPDAGAKALFVKTNGTGNVCSFATPCSLQTALSRSETDQTIYVATGVYTNTGPAVVSLTKGITLLGGWDGSAAIPPVRDSQLYPTILDGERVRRVVSISGDITPTLDGFTILNGNGTG